MNEHMKCINYPYILLFSKSTIVSDRLSNIQSKYKFLLCLKKLNVIRVTKLLVFANVAYDMYYGSCRGIKTLTMVFQIQSLENIAK